MWSSLTESRQARMLPFVRLQNGTVMDSNALLPVPWCTGTAGVWLCTQGSLLNWLSDWEHQFTLVTDLSVPHPPRLSPQ